MNSLFFWLEYTFVSENVCPYGLQPYFFVISTPFIFLSSFVAMLQNNGIMPMLFEFFIILFWILNFLFGFLCLCMLLFYLENGGGYVM